MKFILDTSGKTIVVVPKNDRMVIYPTPMDYVIGESFPYKVSNHICFEAPIELMDELDSIENPTYKSIIEHLTLLKKQL